MLNVRYRNILSLCVILLFTLFVLFQTTKLDYFNSQIMPIVICSILTVLSVIAIIMEIRKIKLCAGRSDEQSISLSQSLLYLLPLPALCALVWVTGFYGGIFLFVSAYNRMAGGSWKEALAVGAIMSVLIWLIFSVALQVDLTSGLILEHFNN